MNIIDHMEATECSVIGCTNTMGVLYIAVYKMPYFNKLRSDKFTLELEDCPVCAEHALLLKPLKELAIEEWEWIVNQSLEVCVDVPDRSKSKMTFKPIGRLDHQCGEA